MVARKREENGNLGREKKVPLLGVKSGSE